MIHANTERPSRRESVAPRRMASARSRSTHSLCLPCVRVFVGSLDCEPNITFTLFYDPREHRASIQTHSSPPGCMASARSLSTHSLCTFHASGYSLAHSSANRTSLSLYSMIHANTERPTRRAACTFRLYGVRPIAVDSFPMRLPCVRVFVGSLVCEPNITFTLFYDPREHRASIQTRAHPLGVWRPPDRGRLIGAVFINNSPNPFLMN